MRALLVPCAAGDPQKRAEDLGIVFDEPGEPCVSRGSCLALASRVFMKASCWRLQWYEVLNPREQKELGAACFQKNSAPKQHAFNSWQP